MTGSVLDACLCLLLVSAAAVTVATVPEQSQGLDRADAAASTLSTTATFEYSLAPGARRADPDLVTFQRTAGPTFTREARGSLASLLARAAVRTVRVNGNPVTHVAADFERETVAATRDALPVRTQVVVRWRPYRGAHVARQFTIGPRPPADTEVNAATVRVPSGVSTPENASSVARRRGFAGLSSTVARALVTGLVPPEKARLALAADPPTSTLMEYRYRRLAALYGTNVSAELDEGDARAANRKLSAAAADEVEADLRREFDGPEDAARSLDPDTVRIVVRTWSA